MRTIFAVLTLLAFAFIVGAPLQAVSVVEDAPVDQLADAPDAPEVAVAIEKADAPEAISQAIAGNADIPPALPAPRDARKHPAILARSGPTGFLSGMWRPDDVQLTSTHNYESGLSLRRV